MYSYCTLFDKNYLDKGLVLIDSFRTYNKSSKLYILAMDDVCYNSLCSIDTPGIIPVRLDDFETEELLQAKSNRSRGEYCWTCAASFIYYILQNYQEEYCTYIDADLCFYADPDSLVDEMIRKGKSVQIVEHRFQSNFAGRFQQKISGRFCVEFNTFRNDKDGLKVLETWRKQTLEQCGFSYGTAMLGDQMYLDEWPEKYSDCVNILENLGAGLAPWNLNRYRFVKEEQGLWVTFDNQPQMIQVVFYHYHDLHYLDRKHIDIGVHKRFWKLDMELTLRLYEEYLRNLEEKKKWIERNFGFCPMVQGNAVGVVNEKRMVERIKALFHGNAYENIRIRMENHLKIFLFRKKDIVDISQALNN